jgi:hypothetical protein
LRCPIDLRAELHLGLDPIFLNINARRENQNPGRDLPQRIRLTSTLKARIPRI